MAKKLTVAVVKQDEQKPVERNVLAQAIVDISRSIKKLTSSGLDKSAIITLVAARVKSPHKFGKKPGKGDIEAVFNALASLEKDYIR